MSSINFASQETPTYGRQQRKPTPTARIQTHNQIQAEKENRRVTKAAKQNPPIPAGPRPAARPLNGQARQLVAPAGLRLGPPVLAPVRATSHPSSTQLPADGFPRPGPTHEEFTFSGLRMPTPGDPAAHTVTRLPQELEPHGHEQENDSLSAEELYEMGQDPEADHGDPPSDGEDDHPDEVYAHPTADVSTSSPPVDNRITSTPVDLGQPRQLVRRTVNHSSPAVPSPAPTLAYHTPTPTAPYTTNPRGLVRRSHIYEPHPSSSPTPVIGKRTISEVDGARDERDAAHYSDADDEEDVVTVLRAADLSPVRRRLFDVAVCHMRMLSMSEGPYGDALQMHQVAVAAWYASQAELRETHGYEGAVTPTHDEIVLLMARSHQVKGDFKTVSRDVVLGKKGYNFNDDSTPEAIAYNHQLVTTLLSNNAFLYCDPLNRDLPGSLYEHPAIQEVFNRVFFNDDGNSEAILTPKYFEKGMPLKVGAFIANSLECVISEHAIGARVKCRMSAKTWQPKFEKHFKILEDWKVYTTNSGSHLTQKLQVRMVQEARRYAKVDITPTGFEEAGMSTADFAKNDA
ncbi:hypothetical protein K438DRAFT_1969683 [Mycena galopus ATCC 62051]|nr:hypothetical protein K438DRAFT_1969683 [Mycena galopus ATCC 62051]